MRLRGVRARGHDRLEAWDATLGVEELFDRPGDISLRAPGEGLSCQPLVDAIRDRARATDRVELLLVLDGAQRFDEARPRDELQASGAERLVSGVGDECRLEADATGQPPRQIRKERPIRLDELDALDLAPGGGVTSVGEKLQAIRLDEQCRVRALETDEVEDV